ncbi:MAG: pyruvate kinase [Deltaproteobacteria bacterium]|nr:pyruvate kinase [Deltaproteobacteria bacterium]
MKELRLDLARAALKRRRTRIVATLGPASSSDEVIEKLIVAGVDVFRLNFSHGAHEGHGQNIERVRRIAGKLGRHTAILGDLCGPKIRVGSFEGGSIDLRTGETITVTTRNVVGRGDLVPSQYVELAEDVNVGDRILYDDGKLEMRVTATDKKSEVQCLIVQGGKLKDKKGMNLPGVNVSTPAVTDKDKADATFAAAQGVDFLALSFVRDAKDVLILRDLLKAQGHANLPIIAKIEMPQAIDNIEGIFEVSDGIMVARGDLGVEMLPEEVPLIQNELVRLAIKKNKPVIVATQMLESMIESSRPTRAEVTDVAAAALSRADAVMLSAETAAGKFPVEAVATMDRVLRLVEGYQWKHGQHGRVVEEHPGREGLGAHAADPSEALSRATSTLSRDLEVRAIVVPTRSGRTARLVSAERPAAPIVGLTHEPALARRLSLCWGVIAEVKSEADLARPQHAALEAVRRFGLAEPNEPVLLVWDASTGAGNRVEPTVSILHA